MGLRAFDGIGSSKGVMGHFWFFDFFCFSPCRDPKKAILSPPIQIFRMSSSRRFQWCMTCPKFHTGWPFFCIFCCNGKISVKNKATICFWAKSFKMHFRWWSEILFFWCFGPKCFPEKISSILGMLGRKLSTCSLNGAICHFPQINANQVLTCIFNKIRNNY